MFVVAVRLARRRWPMVVPLFEWTGSLNHLAAAVSAGVLLGWTVSAGLSIVQDGPGWDRVGPFIALAVMLLIVAAATAVSR